MQGHFSASTPGKVNFRCVSRLWVPHCSCRVRASKPRTGRRPRGLSSAQIAGPFAAEIQHCFAPDSNPCCSGLCQQPLESPGLSFIFTTACESSLPSSTGSAPARDPSFACSPHFHGILLGSRVKPFAAVFASHDAIFDDLSGVRIVRTTVNIDEELLAKAVKLTGPLDRSAVLHEGLRALIQRESAKRLARLGGSQPDLKAAARRRQEIKS